MIQIGKEIEKAIRNQGKSVTWFAAQLDCTRVTVYNIFHRKNIDTQQLYRISIVLKHNFFADCSDAFKKVLSDRKVNH